MKGSLLIIITQAVSYRRPVCFSTVFFVVVGLLVGWMDGRLRSLKTVSHEAFNNTMRFINGFSTFLLVVLPTKVSLEGIHEGWELHPTFCAPHLPQWMEE
jgi:hypothetical protein